MLYPDSDADPLVEVVDIPMTLAGLSRFNVENALGAASAALAVGLPREAVVEGLTSFRPDPAHNPGRMNFFSRDDVSVVIDLAHNEAGLEALLEIMNGVRRPAPGCCSASARWGTGRTTSSTGSGRWAPATPTSWWSRTRRSTCAAARPRSSTRCSGPVPRGSGVEDVPSYPTEVEGWPRWSSRPGPGTSSR